MNELTTLEHNKQRVLTTAQLAESYGTDEKRISENFTRNEERYQLEKHYYRLEGEELKEFLQSANCGIQNIEKVRTLYLWTEKGAWLHAKSLNTDKAWEAYETLVDEYYRIKETVIPQLTQLSPELQLFNSIFQSVAKMELSQKQLAERIDINEQTLTTVKETFLHRDENWRDGIKKMINNVARDKKEYQAVYTNTYQQLECRAGCDLNARLRNLQERLAKQGASKTKIGKLTRLDVIENDKKLKEIYDTIVKEMSLARV